MSQKVFINPGHGGKDAGATSGGLKEKDLTLQISKKINNQLQDYDVTTKLYRGDDSFKELSDIANTANDWGADVFLSVHINNAGGEGFETFIWNGGVSDETKAYRGEVHDAIMEKIDAKDRGKKTANLAVVRETTMPAVLTENLFIDFESDAEKLKDDSFLDKLATGHVNGIVNYLDAGKKKKKKKKKKEKPDVKLPNTTLQKGQQGKNVKKLQKGLEALNFKVGASGVDGHYGADTKDAVERFQKVHLPKEVDGIYGTNTRSKMKKELK